MVRRTGKEGRVHCRGLDRIAIAVLLWLPASLVRADTAPAPQSAQTLNARPAAPPQSIFALAADGGALHQQSQLQCPATLDGYSRHDLRVYDKAGFDVSCDYGGPQSDVTIYLTRRDPAQLPAVFEGARQAILKRFADATARDAAIPLPPGLAWKSAGFVSSKGTQFDDLLLADVSGWEFQVRATYLESSAEATHKLVSDLSALTLRTAGTHLAACAAAPAPARAGQPVGNVDYFMTLVVSGIAMARLAKPPAAEPVWCAEGAFPLGQVNPVFWRNITFDGKSGDADRISSADPRIIEVRLDPASGEVAAKQGTPMDVYDVIVGDADNADLIGIFNGRPSPSDVGKLVFSGQTHVYARFNLATKNIQVFTGKPKPPAPPQP